MNQKKKESFNSELRRCFEGYLVNISVLKIATHENKTSLKYKYVKLETLFCIKKQNKKKT
jgi:hypothetical protein